MAQRSAVRRMMPLIVVGGVVIALAAAVWFGQRSLMYPADRSAVPPAGELLFDYRGYGGNQGSPSEQGLARDVRAARSYLLQEAGVAPDELIYLGESVGTGVVSELATEYPPTALVLRSPMTSFADVARALYKVPIGRLLRDRYPVLANVEQLTGPIAVVVEGADDLRLDHLGTGIPSRLR